MKKVSISLVLLLGALITLTGCERPSVQKAQTGYRGTAMVNVQNPRLNALEDKNNELPVSTGLAPADGPKASEVYQNVKVLGNLSQAQFTTFMVSMTSWVAPEQGCGYCHNVANFAEDSKYTKIVARRMVQMNQNINANWKDHVKGTGVTCYTCHRGNNIPQNVWFKDAPQNVSGTALGQRNGQNMPAKSVGYASLNDEPFSKYLLENNPARIQGKEGLPNGNKHSLQETEHVYAIMMHFSKSLGVNCTYCHNSRAFSDWSQSTPQRALAWHAIQMVKDVNNTYMEPLTSTFPDYRLGPTNDVAKANCLTCHQGVNKPLYGKSMLGDYPYLADQYSEGKATDTKTTEMKTMDATVAAVK
jgi:photosynthetic reaction center cytochrome c subunit